MTAGGGLTIASRGKCRWVGRAGILPARPHLPQWTRYLALTVSFLGLQLVWSCEMSRAAPFLLSLGISKSMMSVVFLAGPLSGLIVQPLVGVLSDGCKSRLGRRRPFIIAGCVLTSLSVMMLGWSKEIASVFATPGTDLHSHLAIASAVISVYIIDFSVNVIQAMDRSLLVDVVSPAQQPAANAWAGRMFGFGAVFGYWIGGIDLVWWTRGLLGDEQLKVLTFFTSFFLCATHAITCSCVEERILISREDDEGKEAGGPLRALGEIWTTIKTLPRPIRQVFNVQFTGWIGWFPILFFSTTWIAETYVKTLPGADRATDLGSATEAVREAATKAGTHAMLWHSVVSLISSIIIPPLVRTDETSNSSAPTRRRMPESCVERDLPRWVGVAKALLPKVPFDWLSLPLLWAISNAIFAFLLFGGTWTAHSVFSASCVIAAAGFCWAVTNWAPFAILGELILSLDGDSGSESAQLDEFGQGSRSPIRLRDNSSRQRLDSLDGTDTSTESATLTLDAELPSYSGVRSPETKRSQASSPVPNRSTPPAQLDLAPKSPLPVDQSLGPAFTARSRSDTVETLSSFGSPRTARSAYFDATSSVEGDARSVTSGDGTPDYADSNGSHTPRLGTGEWSASAARGEFFSPSTPPRPANRKRESIASSSSDQSSIAFPPNHGVVGIDLFDAAARGPSGLGGPHGPGQWYGADPYAYHSGSTVHLPAMGLSPPRFQHRSRSRSSTPQGRDGSQSPKKNGGAARRSRSFERLSSAEAGRYSYDRSDKDASDQDDDLVVHSARGLHPYEDSYDTNGHSGLTPRIVVAGEDGDSLRDWSADEGTNTHGGDQTGVILGCHNVFLVLPQFLVSGFSSIIFALFAPHHSVLGHAAPVPAPASPSSSSSDATLAAIEAFTADDLDRRHLVLRGLAAFGKAFVEPRNHAVPRADPDDSLPGASAGWDALGLIFRLGGISAAVSAWVCYRMWREHVQADRRAKATARGYMIG
ncbi:hypothetical protein BMF94_3133 [Rhodotorula taiwanensis]|uniref:Sucrose transporter n=1 Tax=Rhodotorula taiwanensis TaxID=741276 RepID=A0A2S5B9Z2_9BASI|nr:hypothetical protein BMF94_3133 [Rhodotorula taiwanensis]